jgi:hypothetical protein
MSKSKHGLDQFYTKEEVAQDCLNTLDITSFDVVIEPSAGEGVFFHKVNHENNIAFDIDPKSDDIIQCDFLKKDLTEYKDKKVLFYGNPPFGRNSSLALKFIKKCSEVADTIAFILPKGFKKRSMIDKIPLDFEIVEIQDLSSNTFTYNGKDYDVPCVWMILRKSDVTRTKEEKLVPTKFTFTEKQHANLAIRRVGVNAGNVFLDTDVSLPSHYFINVENPQDAYDKIRQLVFSSNDTTGPRSISKNELIEKLDGIL